MDRQLVRGHALYAHCELLALRTLRTMVDGGLWSEYPHRSQPTYQRPGYYRQPVWIWDGLTDEARLEWV